MKGADRAILREEPRSARLSMLPPVDTVSFAFTARNFIEKSQFVFTRQPEVARSAKAYGLFTYS